MPELPEVQAVVNYFSNILQGKIIHLIDSPNCCPKVFGHENISYFNKAINEKQILKLARRGKYIIFHLNKGFLVLHLRMTGALYVSALSKEQEKHLSFRIMFKDGEVLYFYDIRKFGRLIYCETLYWLDQKLGIEPLSDEFDPSTLGKMLNKRKRMVKSLLLDQSFIAGLGNIYVDEVLWMSRTHPKSISNKIPKANVIQLHDNIRTTLKKAISHNGTTIINFSFGENQMGEFREQLNVFGKQGNSCPDCSEEIKKIRVAQRGTHICNRCQILYM